MSLLLNPAGTVHLNDDATGDLSGNDNDDFNFKVDPAESRGRNACPPRVYVPPSVSEMYAGGLQEHRGWHRPHQPIAVMTADC